MYKNEKESIEVVTIAIDENNVSMLYLEENSQCSSGSQERRERSRQRRNHQIAKHHHQNFSVISDDEVEADDDDDYEEEDDELINFDCCSRMDIKERYLKVIFEPYRFSRTNVFKALGVSIV